MSWRADFLEARDGRQRELDRLLRQSTPEAAASFLLIGANVPGCDKHRPGIARLLRGALDSLERSIGLRVLLSRRDLLGSFHIASSNLPPIDAKRAAVRIEAESPAARLLDVDVYRPDGSQVDRASLKLPPRSCLVCAEPARECILLRRHSDSELLERVDLLLRPFVPSPSRILPELLATNLRLGVLRELDLTPKPGLVDREDSGSHADLSYARHARLRRTAAPLLRRHSWVPPKASPAAGFRAGRDRCRAAHDPGNPIQYPQGFHLSVRSRAHGCLRMRRAGPTFSAGRSRKSLKASSPTSDHRILMAQAFGTAMGWAASGLKPSKACPPSSSMGGRSTGKLWRRAGDPEHASFYLMAVLMQQVEDTTAIHRCGLEGLSRLRQDGATPAATPGAAAGAGAYADCPQPGIPQVRPDHGRSSGLHGSDLRLGGNCQTNVLDRNSQRRWAEVEATDSG